MMCDASDPTTAPNGECAAITSWASTCASANSGCPATAIAIGQAGCSPSSRTWVENVSMSSSSTTCAITDHLVTPKRCPPAVRCGSPPSSPNETVSDSLITTIPGSMAPRSSSGTALSTCPVCGVT